MAFLIFLVSMAATVSLVRGIQGLRRFGWHTRQGLPWWNGVAAAAMCLYFGYAWAGSLPFAVVALAVVLGLAIATLLLITVRPRWWVDSRG